MKSLVKFFLIASLSFASNAAFAAACQVDADGDVDINDIQLITAARNTPASGPDDPRDADGDGVITVNDGRQCALQCDLPSCEEPAPQPDDDGDGVPNDVDNCPNNANPGQEDEDGDGIGDVCDPVNNNDTDGDGVANGADNCPNDANPNQEDADGDGIGDVCDPVNDDVDGDGVANGDDNCPNIPNADQADTDGDGIGDLCDAVNNNDVDGDGVANGADNCPNDPNADQADTDGDGIGDVCDAVNDNDVDGDGVANDVDNCPNNANADQADTDGDGIGNACDELPNDGDNDGVDDGVDNCPNDPNADQADTDGDGVGDVCDAQPNDGDNDGVDDGVDNCPNDPNADQADTDGDGVGDVCDALPNDGDNDGVDDGLDNCPNDPNADQTDTDGDGVGDVCDALPNDGDNDGVDDGADNCPADANPDQADTDGDGIGDVCDAQPNDGDNDGVDDGVDNCPNDPNADQADTDGDGVGDVCDALPNDGDNDGVDDGVDNCPNDPNADQADTDGDGIGDVCDLVNDDVDGDGVANDDDNCPNDANPGQEDLDGDGVGDACDPVNEFIVPDVVGLLRGAAETEILNAGFTVGTVTAMPDASASETVLSQNPPALALALPSANINLVVAAGSIASASVDLDPDVVDVNESSAITCSVFDSFGTEILPTPAFTLTANGGSIANGSFTSPDAGDFDITCDVDGTAVSNTTSIVVLDPSISSLFGDLDASIETLAALHAEVTRADEAEDVPALQAAKDAIETELLALDLVGLAANPPVPTGADVPTPAELAGAGDVPNAAVDDPWKQAVMDLQQNLLDAEALLAGLTPANATQADVDALNALTAAGAAIAATLETSDPSQTAILEMNDELNNIVSNLIPNQTVDVAQYTVNIIFTVPDIVSADPLQPKDLWRISSDSPAELYAGIQTDVTSVGDYYARTEETFSFIGLMTSQSIANGLRKQIIKQWYKPIMKQIAKNALFMRNNMLGPFGIDPPVLSIVLGGATSAFSNAGGTVTVFGSNFVPGNTTIMITTSCNATVLMLPGNGDETIMDAAYPSGLRQGCGFIPGVIATRVITPGGQSAQVLSNVF